MSVNNPHVRRTIRLFYKAWLENENYKPWIRQVPDDNTKFYCIYCNAKFSCGSSHVKRHYESESHKKMASNPQLYNPKDDIRIRPKKFLKKWLEDNELKLWLQEVPKDPTKFKCTACNHTFTGGLSQIKRHRLSTGHKKACAEKNIPEVYTPEGPLLPPFDERKYAMELRYAALVSETHISFRSAKKILKFFQELSEDPYVLQSMKIRRPSAPLPKGFILKPGIDKSQCEGVVLTQTEINLSNV